MDHHVLGHAQIEPQDGGQRVTLYNVLVVWLTIAAVCFVVMVVQYWRFGDGSRWFLIRNSFILCVLWPLVLVVQLVRKVFG